jgi:hypothetical protein
MLVEDFNDNDLWSWSKIEWWFLIDEDEVNDEV